jgi:ribonuclease VapC
MHESNANCMRGRRGRCLRRFGSGRHTAGLNFGDRLTYATARLADEPLLALGGEFAETDLVVAE